MQHLFTPGREFFVDFCNDEDTVCEVFEPYMCVRRISNPCVHGCSTWRLWESMAGYGVLWGYRNSTRVYCIYTHTCLGSRYAIKIT